MFAAIAALILFLMAPLLGEMMSLQQCLGVAMIGLGIGLLAWVGRPWASGAARPR